MAIDDILDRHRRAREEAGPSGADAAFDWAAMELYVSCEPCIMCAAALSQLGLTDIYYGCANDKFGGCGSIVDLCSRASAGCNGCAHRGPATGEPRRAPPRRVVRSSRPSDDATGTAGTL